MTDTDKLLIRIAQNIEKRQSLIAQLVPQIAELEELRDQLLKIRDQEEIIRLVEAINKKEILN